MTRLHRYLLLELLQNGLLALAVVMCVFFLVALALIMGTTRVEGVPFLVVLEHTAYNSLSTLYLIVPMTVLTACLFTYGRLRADGEYTAIRVAGVHPWHVVAPAVAVGAICTLMLGWLQDDVMPAAGFRARRELNQDLVRNIEGILKRNMRLEEKTWKARWARRGEDEDGKLVLYDFELFQVDPRSGAVRSHTCAKSAKPILDEANTLLTLELTDLVRTVEKGNPSVVRGLALELPLEALSSGQASSRRDRDLNYQELITRSDRKLGNAALAADTDDRKKLLEDGRQAATAYHFRIAFAFSAVLFALFGACLGLHHGIGHRVVVFITGFLIVVALYYPLEMFGSWMSDRGVLPPGPALWIGNGVVFGLGLWFWRQTARA